MIMKKPPADVQQAVFISEFWARDREGIIRSRCIYRKLANAAAPMTVSKPETTMDRLLMAPSIPPSYMALAVPMAWEALPMATPRAMGSVMRKSLQALSAKILPKMPVRMMTATVMDT